MEEAKKLLLRIGRKKTHIGVPIDTFNHKNFNFDYIKEILIDEYPDYDVEFIKIEHPFDEGPDFKGIKFELVDAIFDLYPKNTLNNKEE